VQDKKPSSQDAITPMSLYQLNTAELACEMMPQFRAESLSIHFQAL
jgi:hypothetical protein